MVKHLSPFEARRRRVRTALVSKAGGRPRLSVHRSQQHIYAQVIDEMTVESADALEPTLRAAMDVDGPAVVAIPVDYSDNPLLMGQLHLSQIL